MIDGGICDDGFIWNPSICECESCDVEGYLDYGNCKCKRKLIDKLVLEYEDEILNAIGLNTTNTISITDKNLLIYIILLVIMCLILLATVSISCYYYCYTRYLLKKE